MMKALWQIFSDKVMMGVFFCHEILLKFNTSIGSKLEEKGWMRRGEFCFQAQYFCGLPRKNMFPAWEHILWCAQRMALVRWKNGLKGGKNEAF